MERYRKQYPDNTNSLAGIHESGRNLRIRLRITTIISTII